MGSGEVAALLESAQLAAARWNCSEVASIGEQVKVLDAHAFDTGFWATPELVPCVAVLEQTRGVAKPRSVPASSTELLRVFAGIRFGTNESKVYYGELGVAALDVEVAVAIPTTPLAIYALAAYGSVDDYETGRYVRAGGGVEARLCATSSSVCAFADIELAYEAMRFSETGAVPHPERSGLRYGPRVGIDVGNGTWGLRLACELQRHDHGELTEDLYVYRDEGSDFGITFGLLRSLRR